MEYNSNVPIWVQVVTMLKQDIVTCRRPPGSKLPGGRDLALQYTINPNTAARVYQELEREGLCETRRGMGTYITEEENTIRQLRREMAAQAVKQYLASLEGLGYTRAEAIALLQTEE